MTDLQPDKNKFLDSNLKFESFLIAFCDGVSRARKLINILTITSIAALLGLFNSLESRWNWYPSRYDRVREMYHVAFFDNDTLTGKTKKTKLNFKGKIAEFRDTLYENKFEANNFRNLLIGLFRSSEKNGLTKKFNSSVKEEESVPEISKIEKAIDSLKPPLWMQFKLPQYIIGKDSVGHDTINADGLLRSHKEIINGYNMLCISGFTSKTELERYLQNMGRAKLENSTFVRIPILGVAFDVNWLGIISGVGFFAIYFLLYYALSRERKNILMLFKIAEKEGVPDVGIYQYMAMQQVFTIPYSIDEILDADKKNNKIIDKWTNKVKRVLPKITWAIPFVIWGCIFGYDLYTKKIGKIINANLLHYQIVLCTILGIALFYLTYLCLRESVLIDRRWKIQAHKIFEDRKPKVPDEKTEPLKEN